MSVDDRTERVVLRHAAEKEFTEVWAPPGVAAHVEVGETATLYLDAHQRTIGWRLLDRKVGVRENYR